MAGNINYPAADHALVFELDDRRLVGTVVCFTHETCAWAAEVNDDGWGYCFGGFDETATFAVPVEPWGDCWELV